MKTNQETAPWGFEEGEKLAKQVVEICQQNGIMLGVAESCTGGLLGAMLTAVPGASDVFLGGVISYANSVKEALLFVSNQDLARVGAVSEEVAKQMAKGVCLRTGCSVGVSVTGIAGPGGGSAEKPVGTVYEAVCVSGVRTEVRKFRFGTMKTRAEIRLASVRAALEFVLEEVQKEVSK